MAGPKSAQKPPMRARKSICRAELSWLCSCLCSPAQQQRALSHLYMRLHGRARDRPRKRDPRTSSSTAPAAKMKKGARRPLRCGPASSRAKCIQGLSGPTGQYLHRPYIWEQGRAKSRRVARDRFFGCRQAGISELARLSPPQTISQPIAGASSPRPCSASSRRSSQMRSMARTADGCRGGPRSAAAGKMCLQEGPAQRYVGHVPCSGPLADQEMSRISASRAAYLSAHIYPPAGHRSV